ncbi:MAG: RuBisCO large subunit C-terminal-like domain-containing protein [Nitrospiraceae bacterium]|jgi:2,3-diketo-5-methylthiopentyl-1-phosphate enolase|nr:RuBisCO large subunit C-terminal-like domain-containing protein [Nitrospiraceae bacterium]
MGSQVYRFKGQNLLKARDLIIRVTYRFPAGTDLAKLARMVAVGQSAGTWSPKYEDRKDRLSGHMAEIIDLVPHESGGGLAVIDYPVSNCPDSTGSLLTAIMGKYSMAIPMKVIDLVLPEGYGVPPAFGIDGIRRSLGVFDRPLLMAIFKPSLGLTASEHGEIFREAAFSGIDLMKDDEILPDIPECSALDRLTTVRTVVDEIWRTQKRRVLYAVNLSGRADEILRKARVLVSEGANALLLNVLSYGYPVLEALAADPLVNVPIFCHPALSGVFTGPSDHGFSSRVVLGTLMAHAGGDAVLFPTRFGNFPVSPEEESDLVDTLHRSSVFPVPSGGVTPLSVLPLCQTYGKEIIINAGTAIMDHPEGVSAGVGAFVTALSDAGWKQESALPFQKRGD